MILKHTEQDITLKHPVLNNGKYLTNDTETHRTEQDIKTLVLNNEKYNHCVE